MHSLRYLLIALLGCHSLTYANSSDQEDWVYTVKPGETLWSIAREHLTSLSHAPALQQKNTIRNAYALRPGSQIRIPLQWVRQNTGKASVTELVGSAQLIINNNQTSLLGGTSYSLPAGAIIRTAANSSLKLQFEDGSLVNIGPNAQFSVKRSVHFPTTGANATWLNIERGSIDNNVSKNPLMPNRHTIQTPSAITAVRGTSFRVNVGNADSSATEVLEGKVEVNAAGQSEQIGGGFGSVTRRGEAPGKSLTLPPPPDLGGIARIQQHSPVVLGWPAVSGMNGYQLNILRTAPERQMVDDKLVALSHDYPALSNGEYRLTARSQLPNGLQGIPASQTITVHAHPTPPLVVSPAPNTRLRKREVRFVFGIAANPGYLLQLSRDKDFSQIQSQTLHQHEYQTTLPDGGTWFWRVARQDDNGKTGPFSPTYQLQTDSGWLRASHIQGSLITGRPYPLQNGRYQLTLRSLDRNEAAITLEASQPQWQMTERLFPGRYLASYRISGDNGYQAREEDQTLIID